MNFFKKHPIISLCLFIVACVVALDATESVATIETYNGVDYITAVDGEELPVPRKATKYDLGMKWDRK